MTLQELHDETGELLKMNVPGDASVNCCTIDVDGNRIEDEAFEISYDEVDKRVVIDF